MHILLFETTRTRSNMQLYIFTYIWKCSLSQNTISSKLGRFFLPIIKDVINLRA